MRGIVTEVSVASIDQNQPRFELEARAQQLQDQLAVEMIHTDHSTLKNMLLQFCNTGFESEPEFSGDENDKGT